MSLFLVLVLFFMRAMYLLVQVQKQGKVYARMEAKLQQTGGELEAIKQYYASGSLGWRAKAYRQEMMEYLLIRKRFIMTLPSEIKDNFNFSTYINNVLGHTAAHLVHIPPSAWVVIEIFFVILWAGMTSQPNLRLR